MTKKIQINKRKENKKIYIEIIRTEKSILKI